MGEQIDRYVEKPELARIFGFQNIRDVDRVVENGIIEPHQRGRGQVHTNFDLVPSVTSYIKHLKDKASGRDRRDSETELKNQKLKAEIALKESQGELHKLRTEIAQGQYISVDEVKLDYTRFFLVFKQFATAIPARLISILAGTIEPIEARRLETMLSNEVQNQLKAFVLAARTPDMETQEESAEQSEEKEEKSAKKVAKKTPTKKTPTKKSPAKKTTTKKTTAKKTTVKKTTKK